jgi:membrane-associated phospholipid phosphatase
VSVSGDPTTDPRPTDAPPREAAPAGPPSAGAPPSLRRQADGLDRAVYGAVASAPTPALDRFFSHLSTSANHSKLWMAAAATIALTGAPGRRAAADGLVAIAVASAVTNAVAKPLGGRRRPDREGYEVPVARHVTMPESTSFPSGHSASAFAFASAVAGGWPAGGTPVRALATLVAYSRVHTGVHYPGDVIAGSFIGGAVGPVVAKTLRRVREARRRRATA